MKIKINFLCIIVALTCVGARAISPVHVFGLLSVGPALIKSARELRYVATDSLPDSAIPARDNLREAAHKMLATCGHPNPTSIRIAEQIDDSNSIIPFNMGATSGRTVDSIILSIPQNWDEMQNPHPLHRAFDKNNPSLIDFHSYQFLTGHEWGHLKEKHVLKNIATPLGAALIPYGTLIAAKCGLHKMAPHFVVRNKWARVVLHAAAVVAAGSSYVWQVLASYSQRQMREYEADVHGGTDFDTAIYGARHLLYWNKMEPIIAPDERLLVTHPDSLDRAERLYYIAKKHINTIPEDYQEIIKKRLDGLKGDINIAWDTRRERAKQHPDCDAWKNRRIED